MMKSLILALLFSSTANADPVRIDEHASRKIFSVLVRSGAKVTPLSHHHDREYALQESVRAQNIMCEFGQTISCAIEISTDEAQTEARRIEGEDAWTLGFNLSEAGIRRVSRTVTAKSLLCILKGAGRSASCIAEE
jgi:hypothetical protein